MCVRIIKSKSEDFFHAAESSSCSERQSRVSSSESTGFEKGLLFNERLVLGPYNPMVVSELTIS